MHRSRLDLSSSQLLAPAQIVRNEPIRDGYELGLAATADVLKVACPVFPLTESQISILEICLGALVAAHDAYHGRSSGPGGFVQDEELSDQDPPSLIERLRDTQRRFTMVAEAVAAADTGLSKLRRLGLELVTTTQSEPVISFGDVDDAFELVAEVSVVQLKPNGYGTGANARQ